RRTCPSFVSLPQKACNLDQGIPNAALILCAGLGALRLVVADDIAILEPPPLSSRARGLQLRIGATGVVVGLLDGALVYVGHRYPPATKSRQADVALWRSRSSRRASTRWMISAVSVGHSRAPSRPGVSATSQSRATAARTNAPSALSRCLRASSVALFQVDREVSRKAISCSRLRTLRFSASA